jgi:hypothetical protein
MLHQTSSRDIVTKTPLKHHITAATYNVLLNMMLAGGVDDIMPHIANLDKISLIRNEMRPTPIDGGVVDSTTNLEKF